MSFLVFLNLDLLALFAEVQKDAAEIVSEFQIDKAQNDHNFSFASDADLASADFCYDLKPLEEELKCILDFVAVIEDKLGVIIKRVKSFDGSWDFPLVFSEEDCDSLDFTVSGSHKVVSRLLT